jgi:hypothetical protein
MKIRRLLLMICAVLAALASAPRGANAQGVTLGPKKIACDKDHLAMTTTVTNGHDIALKVIVAVLLREEKEHCLQAVQHELELQPKESSNLLIAFDKVPCVEGRYRTEHKVYHDYVSRMVAQGKFEELFRQPALDCIPKKYQELFKKFDADAKEKLINAVRSGDLESQLMAEFNSFMLQCP